VTEKEAFGMVYRQLRTEAGETMQEVAGKLKRQGLEVTSKAGVLRLEERGSMELPYIRAYSRMFKITQAKMEDRVQHVLVENSAVS